MAKIEVIDDSFHHEEHSGATSEIQNIEGSSSQATRNAENERNMQLVISKPRLSRENGYGDFCFQRLTASDREKDPSFYPGPDSEWTDEELLLYSNNHPFKELGFFKRKGIFPFLKLPPEIQRMVIEMLIESLRTPYYLARGRSIQALHIKKKHIPRPMPSFSAYLEELKDDLYEFDDDSEAEHVNLRKLSPKEFRQARLNYLKEQKDYLHILKRHPRRKQQYELDLSPRKTIETKNGNNDDWPMIELIRNLSNVSTYFREQLGKAFWDRIHLSMCLDTFSASHLRGFLEERPKILRNIQSIYIKWSFEFALPHRALSKERMENICSYLAKSLVLQHFELALEQVQDNKLDDLGCVKGVFKALLPLRRLVVKKEFSIDLDCDGASYTGDDRYDDDNEDFIDYKGELEDKYSALLLEYTLPDSLRTPKPQTEEEKHLVLRLQ